MPETSTVHISLTIVPTIIYTHMYLYAGDIYCAHFTNVFTIYIWEQRIQIIDAFLHCIKKDDR